jgi:hypothetical protein
VDGVRKTMIFMLHLWEMAHYHIEIPTLEEFLNVFFVYFF